jgi:ATP phosphoribosyltransferase regulatory subunit
VSYIGELLRPAPAGKAQRFEERQAGVELVGVSGAAADAEVIGIVVSALRDLGLTDLSVGLGDVSLTRAVLDGVGVPQVDQDRLRDATRAHNLVAWRRIAESLELPAEARTLIAGLPMRRGGAELLAELAVAAPNAAAACAQLNETLEVLAAHGAADVVIVDLGVLRDWGYYSGVVFEVYAPGIGHPVAAGGRYDGLIGRFGVPRPAVGGSVRLDRLHEALAARNGPGTMVDGLVLAGGFSDDLALARVLRAAGEVVVAAPQAPGMAEALAEADGWRFVARRAGDAFAVTDRVSAHTITCADVSEGLRSLRS